MIAEANQWREQLERLKAENEEKSKQSAEARKEIEQLRALAKRLEDNLTAFTKQNNANGSAQQLNGVTDESQQPSELLALVSAQRDRYKSRCDALERDLLDRQRELGSAQLSVQRLQSENVQLYEKVKAIEAAKTDKRKEIAIDIEQKYSRMAEEKNNPFKEFAARQQKLQESNLSMAEKFSLSLTRIVASKKRLRTALFIYALILHALIGIVLWTHTIQSHCEYANHKTIGIN
jgi:homeobox protein cut-like